MYKKKIGARAFTAVTVASLLASNVTPAMAAEDANAMAKAAEKAVATASNAEAAETEDAVEADVAEDALENDIAVEAEEAEKDVTVRLYYYTEAGKTVWQGYQHVTAVEGSVVTLTADDLENDTVTVDGVEYTVDAENPKYVDCKVEYAENINEVRWYVPVKEVEKAAEKDVTVGLYYYTEDGKTVWQGYQNVTAVEGSVVTLTADDLENDTVTVDGVEYTVDAENPKYVDCKVEYAENINEVRWYVPVKEVEKAAEKDVTVGLYYYTEDGKTVWQGYQNVTAVEGSVVTLTADDLENDTVTVDGVEYAVDAENPKYVDCKVEYAENINEVRWYVPVKEVEKAAEKDVTVGLYYYTEDGKTVWQGYQNVTAVEGSVVTLTADDLENDTVTVDGVEYTVDAENPKYVDCKVEYAENINEVRWYVPVKEVEKAAEKDVTVGLYYYTEDGKTVWQGYQNVTAVEGSVVTLTADDLENDTVTVDGVEYTVDAENPKYVDCKVEYAENINEVRWYVPVKEVEKAAEKDVTVGLYYYTEDGKTVWQGYQNVTAVEGSVVTLTADDLENDTVTVDGVEYTVDAENPKYVDCKVEYAENINEVRWYVPVKEVEKAAEKDVTVGLYYYTEDGKTVWQGYQHVTAVEGSVVTLTADDLENDTVTLDGVEYTVDAENPKYVDCKVEYAENINEVRWYVPVKEVEKAAEKDVTVGLYYYTEDGKTVWQGYQHVTAVEGSVVTLTADDLENDTVTVDGVEYTVDAENPKYVDCKVEYAENINEVRWYVPVKEVEKAAEKDVTVGLYYYTEDGKTVWQGYQHVTAVEGSVVTLTADDLENDTVTVDGVEYTVDAENPKYVDCKVEYAENINEVRWYVPVKLVEEDVTIEKSIVTVKVHGEGIADGADVDSTIDYDDPDTWCILPKVAVKEGWKFAGWKVSTTGETIETNDEYKLTFEKVSNDREVIDGVGYVTYEAIVKQDSLTPEPDPVDPNPGELKKVTVVYYDADGNKITFEVIGVDKDATSLTAGMLNIPDGYELVEDQDYAIENGVVAIKLQEKATPVEMADATLIISYQYRGSEIKTQTETKNGVKGQIAEFLVDEITLEVPDNYNVQSRFENTKVAYGDKATVVVVLTKASSGGGSGSSGGSGNGSGRSTAISASGTIKGGQWILDHGTASESLDWWYSYTDNSYAKSGWYSLVWQGKTDWYYFTDNGYLVSGWFENNGNKYYLHTEHDGTFGRMYTGWNKVGDQWYYFSEDAANLGALVEGAEVPAELLNQ